MLKSTKERNKIFSKGKEDYWKVLEGYIYARWPTLCIYHMRTLVNKILPDPEVIPRYPDEAIPPEIDELAQMVAERTLPTLLSTETSGYHGKVMRFDETKALLSIDQDVSMTNLEKVIPYKHARDIILKSPERIAVFDCPCRSSKEKPCEPIDVCISIGEPSVSFVLEHKINNARQISRDEAINIVKAEDDRGHVHSAWFKDSFGDRLFTICNCCKCCCNAMKGHFNHVPAFATSGYVSESNEECNGCGTCVVFCQYGAISMIDDRARVSLEKCMGCGVCESKCPVEAISLKRDLARCEPLDMRVLMAQHQTS
jgi:Pyruvate/2-oxoacid:ferredoxin oxidoreductase delta subunit